MSRCTDRIRLLYLTAAFPFPLSSGYLRHYHLLRELACDHHIHLMSLTGPTFSAEHASGVTGFVDRVSTFPKPAHAGRIQRAAQLLDPQRPDAAGLALARAVDDEVGRGAVDVVVLSGKETAAAADAVAGRVPLVVDLCDATSHRISQEISHAQPVRRAGLVVRRRGMRKIERHLIATADQLITASERDRSVLHDEGAPARVLDATVIPNGIDLRYWERSTRTLGSAVAFCGNLGYGPNADAARRLVSEIMPRVWARRPETEVLIIGTGASPALARTLRQPRVKATGSVPDVRPHLELAGVFSAPLRIASGIQNKLLEALAMELPVVTTSVAAAGLQRHGGQPPLDIADDAAGHADAILRQLDLVEARNHRPHHTARIWVAERFSWERSGVALGELVDELRQREQASC
ncbi:glycosyltransferase [Aquihabitans sp. McL0605]|uniref:glycosyltransferase n=1 Tax=Aquihabitans sp. McL0605 TaxID=3415671 RepID=UPI003CF055F5